MANRLAEYRKSSLGDLLQAHLSMQAAIDSLPDPVIIFGVGGDLQNVNHAAGTLLGLSADTAVKEPLKRAHESVRMVLERVRSHVLSGKGAYISKGFEEAVQLPSLMGDRYFLPRGAPVYETRGVVIGATVILQDVTRLRRFEVPGDGQDRVVVDEPRGPRRDGGVADGNTGRQPAHGDHRPRGIAAFPQHARRADDRAGDRAAGKIQRNDSGSART